MGWLKVYCSPLSTGLITSTPAHVWKLATYSLHWKFSIVLLAGHCLHFIKILLHRLKKVPKLSSCSGINSIALPWSTNLRTATWQTLPIGRTLLLLRCTTTFRRACFLPQWRARWTQRGIYFELALTNVIIFDPYICSLLLTVSFSSLFNVPFGNSVRFSMTLNVHLAVAGDALCIIKEVFLGSIWIISMSVLASHPLKYIFTHTFVCNLFNICHLKDSCGFNRRLHALWASPC